MIASLVLVLLTAVGCSPLPEVHEDFAANHPTRILVYPTKNETTLPLEDVRFGGLAQRLTGLRTFNFPALVNRAVEEELLARGYVVSASDPSGEGASSDAELRSAILSWKGSTTPPYRLAMTYRIDLVDVKTGTRLYGGEFSIRVRADQRTPADTSFIRKGIERSVRRSLRLLPAAN